MRAARGTRPSAGGRPAAGLRQAVGLRYAAGVSFLAWLLGVSAGWGTPLKSGEDFVLYAGTASRLHGGDELLYQEQHGLRYRDGVLAERVVVYRCQDGRAFARKTLHYRDPVAPDFTLEDAWRGLREGVESEAGGRAVFFRARQDAPERRRTVGLAPGAVIDAGFDALIVRRWDELVSGRAVEVSFLVPSRLKELRFEVLHARSDRFQGIPVEVFHVRLDGVFGWLLPGIDMYYSKSARLLVHYEGPSDLRDATGSNYEASITFPLAARSAADVAAFQALKSEPLQPCR